jgi:hypothetical protein
MKLTERSPLWLGARLRELSAALTCPQALGVWTAVAYTFVTSG